MRKRRGGKNVRSGPPVKKIDSADVVRIYYLARHQKEMLEELQKLVDTDVV